MSKLIIDRKRSAFIRRMAEVGIDLGQLGTKLTFYACVAGATFILGGSYLMINLPSPVALTFYATIIILVILIQIVQILRREREMNEMRAFRSTVENYIATRMD